jgi:hypothetical protein
MHRLPLARTGQCCQTVISGELQRGSGRGWPRLSGTAGSAQNTAHPRTHAPSYRWADKRSGWEAEEVAGSTADPRVATAPTTVPLHSRTVAPLYSRSVVQSYRRCAAQTDSRTSAQAYCRTFALLHSRTVVPLCHRSSRDNAPNVESLTTPCRRLLCSWAVGRPLSPPSRGKKLRWPKLLGRTADTN